MRIFSLVTLFTAFQFIQTQGQTVVKTAKNDAYKSVNPEELINIKNKQDVKKLRKQAIKIIFGMNELPKGLPEIKIGVEDDFYGKMNNLLRLDKFEITLEHGLKSVGNIYTPINSNNKLMIFHEGHGRGRNPNLYKTNIQFFLEKGFTIYHLSMPLYGFNKKKPIVDIPNIGKVPFEKHEDFAYLENPLSYFISPVIQMINYAERSQNFDQIAMVGLSGGGWTTTIVAGIDQRVEKSFPVAGSYPIYIRFYHRKKDMGDFEQMYPALFNVVNYLDFYVLGAYGKGRKQVQILNFYDSCCFDGDKYKHYENSIKKTIESLGEGEFKVYSDTTHKQHKISYSAMELILKEILN